MSGKLSVQVESFKPLRSNTLYGLCHIAMPEMRLRIFDLTVHEITASAGSVCPQSRNHPRRSRPQGRPRQDRLLAILEFVDAGTRNAFSQRVIQSLPEFAPSAFDPDERPRDAGFGREPRARATAGADGGRLRANPAVRQGAADLRQNNYAKARRLTEPGCVTREQIELWDETWPLPQHRRVDAQHADARRRYPQ